MRARHRNAARPMVEQIPLGPNAMALRERCVAVLLDSGLPPWVAAYAYATLSRYVLGFAVQVTGHGGAGRPEDTRAEAAFRSVDPDLCPATVVYTGRAPEFLADAYDMRYASDAVPDLVHFGWAGSTDVGEPHYGLDVPAEHRAHGYP